MRWSRRGELATADWLDCSASVQNIGRRSSTIEPQPNLVLLDERSR
jgi:hypothetical protein